METKNNEAQTNISKDTSWVPREYKEPSLGENYMKFKEGDNNFRILSSMIMGWEDWTDEPKPVRFRYENKPDAPILPDGRISLFWLFAVWNYAEERVQLLSLTQASIRKSIEKLASDPKWGNPCFYDLNVIQMKQSNGPVKYIVIPSPHSNISKSIKEAYQAKPINWDAHFEGGNVFAPKKVSRVA